MVGEEAYPTVTRMVLGGLWACAIISLRRVLFGRSSSPSYENKVEINLIVSDGLSGFETAVQKSYPGIVIQLSTVHLQRELCRDPRISDKGELNNNLTRLFSPKGALSRAPKKENKLVLKCAENGSRS